jgi:hypothetical protein
MCGKLCRKFQRPALTGWQRDRKIGAGLGEIGSQHDMSKKPCEKAAVRII